MPCLVTFSCWLVGLGPLSAALPQAPAVRYLAHRWRNAVDCSLELSQAARYARAGLAVSWRFPVLLLLERICLQILSDHETQLANAAQSGGGSSSTLTINTAAGKARKLRAALGLAGTLLLARVVHHHCVCPRMRMQSVYEAQHRIQCGSSSCM